MKTEQDPAAEATAVQRLLMGLVDRVSRVPWVVLTVALVLCGLSLYAAWTSLEYRTQRTDLVSPNKDYQKRWRQYLAEFGADDDIVVVVQGSDVPRMKGALEELAAQVRAQPRLFDRVFYKVDLRHLNNRALLFLSTAQIRLIQNYLRSEDMRLLLEPSLGGVADPLLYLRWSMVALGRILDKAGSVADKIRPGQPLARADTQILAQLSAISRMASATLQNPATYHNPWQSLIPRPSGQQEAEQECLLTEPQYFFSGDRSLAFLLVRPIQKQGSFAGAGPSVDALRVIVEKLRPRLPGLSVGLTGLPVLEADEMTASENDTHLASGLAFAGVALLFLVVYRGLRNPFLTVSTLVVGTLWAMGWMTLTVGHLNILSATFAVMLIGMGDYGVLWVTRYEQNRAAGNDVRTALRLTAAGGGPSILTAALATAAAFFAAMLADFQAVAELGWIAGSGVLLCALSCFTVLPALLTLLDRRQTLDCGLRIADFNPQSAIRNPQSAMLGWLPGLARRPRLVIGGGLALTAALGLCAFRIKYDHNLLHMQARGLESVTWEMTLIQHTAGANWHALSYTNNPQEALALKARYEKLPEVSRVVEVASLVPSDQEQKLEQLRDIQQRLRSLPERDARITRAQPHPGALQKQLVRLLDKLEHRGDAQTRETLAKLRSSLRSLHAQLTALPEEVAARRLKNFEERLTGDLVDNLHRLRAVSTPAAITVADLPPSLAERYIGKNGKWLLRAFARDCLWDHAPLQQFVDKIHTVDPEATGKPFATLEGLRALKNGFQWAGLYALIAIMGVFWLDFRNLHHTLWALTPLALGVIICLGIMGLFGLPLNPANMIAFPLILGVGAVYGVHVVHDFLVRQAPRDYTLSYVIGRAIMVMALTNMISFGTLLISRHRGLSGLGFTLLLGVGCCMATALVFLPAVLRLLSIRKKARLPGTACVQESRVAA